MSKSIMGFREITTGAVSFQTVSLQLKVSRESYRSDILVEWGGSASPLTCLFVWVSYESNVCMHEFCFLTANRVIWDKSLVFFLHVYNNYPYAGFLSCKKMTKIFFYNLISQSSSSGKILILLKLNFSECEFYPILLITIEVNREINVYSLICPFRRLLDKTFLKKRLLYEVF